jgi:HPt (histidine-containing phosphotransfer) domain-containing protein/CheY-like chemotaxis protein
MITSHPVPKDFEGLLEPKEIHALQDEFLDETTEELERVMNALAATDYAHLDEDSIHPLFRTVHNLKGSASVFGYEDLSRIGHAVESSLARYRGLPAGSISVHIDDILFLAGLLLGLVRDGKVDRMDCAAAEKALASWSEIEHGKHRGDPTEPGSPAEPGSGIASTSAKTKPADDTLSQSGGGQTTALIVDSARSLHHTLHRFLEPYNVAWHDCGSGAEVIERCAIEHPDLLFLGYLLPDMTTAELLPILYDAGIAPPMIAVISSESEDQLRYACPYPFTFIRKDHTLLGALRSFVRSRVAE